MFLVKDQKPNPIEICCKLENVINFKDVIHPLWLNLVFGAKNDMQYFETPKGLQL